MRRNLWCICFRYGYTRNKKKSFNILIRCYSLRAWFFTAEKQRPFIREVMDSILIMPAQHHIDKKNKLIITSWEGKAIDIDFIEAMKKYQENVQSDPDYIDYNEVLDFSKVTDIQVTINGIRNVGKIASATDKGESCRKLAIIAPSNKLFFFARLYKIFRSLPRKSNKDVNIFTKESDAIEWAKSETL